MHFMHFILSLNHFDHQILSLNHFDHHILSFKLPVLFSINFILFSCSYSCSLDNMQDVFHNIDTSFYHLSNIHPAIPFLVFFCSSDNTQDVSHNIYTSFYHLSYKILAKLTSHKLTNKKSIIM